MAFKKVSKSSSKIHSIIGSYFIKEVSMRKGYYFLFIILLFVSLIHGQENFEELYSSDSRIYDFGIDSLGNLYLTDDEGLHRSIDSGENWELIFDENLLHQFCLTPSNEIFIQSLGNCYFSMNFEDWQLISNYNTVGCRDFSYDTSGQLFIYGWRGIAKSIDGGYTWQQTFSTNSGEVFNTFIESSDGTYYAGSTAFLADTENPGGFFRSFDQGDTWENIGLPNYFIQSLTETSTNELFACTSGHATTGATVIMHSTDQGATWNQCFSSASQMFALTTDSNDNLFVGMGNYPVYLAGIHYSQDNGLTWYQLQTNLISNNAQVDDLYCDSNNYLYAIVNGDYPPYALLKSLEPTTTTVIDEDFVHPVNQISNYPNPFTDETTIVLDFPSKSIQSAKLEIFNVKGQKIREIPVIQQEVKWDGRDEMYHIVSSGVYFVNLTNAQGIRYSSKILKINNM